MIVRHEASSIVASVCLALASAACGAEDASDNSPDSPDVGIPDADQAGVSDQPSWNGDEPSIKAESQHVELATLHFSDQRTLRFSRERDANAIVLEEFGPLSKRTAKPILMREPIRSLSALEAYLALTPIDRAVPRALYELGTTAAARPSLDQRALVESMTPMPAQVISLRLVDTDQDSDFMPELCGASGASEFQDICDTTSSPESFCEPGKHTWHGRYSSTDYNKSEGFTVSCQASVRTRHRRRVALTWWDNYFYMDADDHWHFTRVENYAPASQYDRFVRMDRYNPTNSSSSVSFIRSWIGFRN